VADLPDGISRIDLVPVHSDAKPLQRECDHLGPSIPSRSRSTSAETHSTPYPTTPACQDPPPQAPANAESNPGRPIGCRPRKRPTGLPDVLDERCHGRCAAFDSAAPRPNKPSRTSRDSRPFLVSLPAVMGSKRLGWPYACLTDAPPCAAKARPSVPATDRRAARRSCA
jgi:hypothetical protein